MLLSLPSTQDGVTAKVFVEKNSQMNMTTDNKDVVFIKGSSVKASYTTSRSTYFEYDAFVNAARKTVKVTAVDSDTLVYGPSYDTKRGLSQPIMRAGRQCFLTRLSAPI